VRKGLSARSWNAENAQGKFNVIVGAQLLVLAAGLTAAASLAVRRRERRAN